MEAPKCNFEDKSSTCTSEINSGSSNSRHSSKHSEITSKFICEILFYFILSYSIYFYFNYSYAQEISLDTRSDNVTRQLERELLSQLEMELFDDVAEQTTRNKRDANDDLNDALKEITDKLSDFYSKAAIFFHQGALIDH